MSQSTENVNENLPKSFLAAYQNLQFLLEDQTETEVADTERRCLFMKYMMAKEFDCDDVAAVLLQNGLEKYQSHMDDQHGINNYWKEFNSLNLDIVNDPQEWQSGLTNPEIVTKLIKPLPCHNDPTKSCINKQFADRDIEKLTNILKNGGSPRTRKVTKQESIEPISLPRNEPVTKRDIREYQKPHKQIEIQRNNQSNKYKPPIPKNDRSMYKNGENRSNSGHKVYEYGGDNRKDKDTNKFDGFKSARVELGIQKAKAKGTAPPKKTLGGRPLNAQYVNPFKEDKKEEEEPPAEPEDERLKNIEPKMIELIRNEIMDSGTPVSWDDIAGLEHAKRIIKEIVVFPMLRPDIFTGLRRPPKGILLFGPPGTGKTLIGKCIASQSKSTFFSISASSLTSKWIGEGEKMVRALFAVARVEQPSVVFIDEIDSLLCQRSETEHESSRRMKTEFLVQLDGAATGDEDRILVIGATNRPYELDEAARRRLVKRLYVPLPELQARAQIVRNLLKSEEHALTEDEIMDIANLSHGYSGADMTNLCKEASMGPIRSIPFNELENISTNDVRKVTSDDFKQALLDVRPSVSQSDLAVYLDWDRTYGTASAQTR